MGMSFRARLLVWSGIILMLALVLPLWLYGRSVSRDTLVEGKARAVAALDAVTWLLADHGPFRDNAALDAWATIVGPKLGVRITYIVDGRGRGRLRGALRPGARS